MTNHDYQFKFVIDQLSDIQEVENYLGEFPSIDSAKVYLMPQGIEQEQLTEKMTWLETLATDRGWQVSPRLHIELFGNTRGT